VPASSSGDAEQLINAGMPEHYLTEVSTAMGTVAEELVVESKGEGRAFADKLAAAVAQGRPAVMAMN